MEIRKILRCGPLFLMMAVNASCVDREEIFVEKMPGERLLFKTRKNEYSNNIKCFESIAVFDIKNVNGNMKRGEYPLWEVAGYTKPGCESRIFFGSEPVGFITTHTASKLKQGETYSVVAQISGNFAEKTFIF